MDWLQALGGIVGGLNAGRQRVEERREHAEDREYLRRVRQAQMESLDRERKAQAEQDALMADIAEGRKRAEQMAAEEAGADNRMFAAKSSDGTYLAFKDRASAEDYLNNRGGAPSSGVTPTGTQTMALPQSSPLAVRPLPPETGVKAPSVAPQALGIKPAATALSGGKAMPRKLGVKPTADTIAATNGAVNEGVGDTLKMPLKDDGTLDIVELRRPKRTADALFYYSMWRNEYRPRYEKVFGIEKANRVDKELQELAHAGYKQRLAEAIALQRAGDNHGVALKLNEIYNRDFVDGLFSNVRMLDDKRVEVIRFKPDGTIVDKHVEAFPDLMAMAVQMLPPDDQVKLLANTQSHRPKYAKIYADGQAALVDEDTGAIRKLGPNVKFADTVTPLISGMLAASRQNDAQQFTLDREREKQRLETQRHNAEIMAARNAVKKYEAEMRAKYPKVDPRKLAPDDVRKAYELADKPLW